MIVQWRNDQRPVASGVFETSWCNVVSGREQLPPHGEGHDLLSLYDWPNMGTGGNPSVRNITTSAQRVRSGRHHALFFEKLDITF